MNGSETFTVTLRCMDHSAFCREIESMGFPRRPIHERSADSPRDAPSICKGNSRTRTVRRTVRAPFLRRESDHPKLNAQLDGRLDLWMIAIKNGNPSFKAWRPPGRT